MASNASSHVSGVNPQRSASSLVVVNLQANSPIVTILITYL